MVSVELPTGTVALLFSDIEGSTRLVQRLGEDAYAVALAECRRLALLRLAVTEHGGCEVDCRADELFAVFPGAGGGVAAAVAMQRAVAAAAWPDDGVVRVRIGLNVGDPVVADDVYVGLAVNRAARICSAGHGGQVLVSDSVRDVVGDAYEFRPLGSYTLAGLPAPEPIFQVVISGARLEFPPLRVDPAKDAPRFRLGRFRRPAAAPTLGDAAWLARRHLPAVGVDVRVPLGELGGALFTAERAAEHADRLLSRVDRERLDTRLTEQRAMAVLSERAEREAESLAAQIATVERATNHRRRLTEMAGEATELLDDPGGVTTPDITGIRDRVAEETEALDTAVTRAAGALDPLCFKLTRTRHRGIYRSARTLPGAVRRQPRSRPQPRLRLTIGRTRVPRRRKNRRGRQTRTRAPVGLNAGGGGFGPSVGGSG